MYMFVKFLFFTTCLAFVKSVISSRVLELSDRFLDIHKEGQWMVMMYAPWCAHCKKLEPVWAHVAQHLYNSPIRVGRVDCTRFTSVGNFFKIKGYPTVIFLKGDEQYVYNGDRTKHEIVKFAQRLSGPPVQEISKSESIEALRKEKDIFFLYIGEKSGALWESFYNAAKTFQPYAFFYQSHPGLIDKQVQFELTPNLVVYKENTYYAFTGYNTSDIIGLNETIHKWINAERFPTFPKVTRGNIDQLFMTNKNLVLAVLEENLLEDITAEMIDFRMMVESIITKRRHKYHNHFQFGWVGSPELISSIAMMHISVPNLIVINTTTLHHHIPEDDPISLTPHAIELFLEQIHNDTAPKLGGNSFGVKMYRGWFNMKSTLTSMWKGNPVLTLVIFGLPAGFLMLICWQGVCCPDIIDSEEEEDDANSNHMKND